MFIPTQEERYSKRTLMTLILCVIAPCLVYAYVSSAKFDLPVDSVAGMLNLIFFFTYPLALAFIKLGVPAMEWGGLNWGGIVCSLLIHAVMITMIYKSKVSPKTAMILAIMLGFTDLLACKLIAAMPA